MHMSELSAEGLSPQPESSDTFSSAPEPPWEASLSSTASESALFTDSSAMFMGRLALCDLLAGDAYERSHRVSFPSCVKCQYAAMLMCAFPMRWYIADRIMKDSLATRMLLSPRASLH